MLHYGPSIFTSRTILLTGHVVAAVLFLGPLTLATSLFPRYAGGRSSDELSLARFLHRVSRTYGTCAVAVGLVGVALAADGELFAEAWVQAGLVLFVLDLAALFAFVLPEQRRHLAVAAGEPPRAGVAPLSLGALRGASGGFAAVWVVIAALMVMKPG